MSEPKQVKGGIIALADISVIKEALLFYANNKELSAEEERHIANLVHRLGRGSN